MNLEQNINDIEIMETYKQTIVDENMERLNIICESEYKVFDFYNTFTKTYDERHNMELEKMHIPFDESNNIKTVLYDVKKMNVMSRMIDFMQYDYNKRS